MRKTVLKLISTCLMIFLSINCLCGCSQQSGGKYLFAEDVSVDTESWVYDENSDVIYDLKAIPEDIYDKKDEVSNISFASNYSETLAANNLDYSEYKGSIKMPDKFKINTIHENISYQVDVNNYNWLIFKEISSKHITFFFADKECCLFNGNFLITNHDETDNISKMTIKSVINVVDEFKANSWYFAVASLGDVYQLYGNYDFDENNFISLNLGEFRFSSIDQAKFFANKISQCFNVVKSNDALTQKIVLEDGISSLIDKNVFKCSGDVAITSIRHSFYNMSGNVVLTNEIGLTIKDNQYLIKEINSPSYVEENYMLKDWKDTYNLKIAYERDADLEDAGTYLSLSNLNCSYLISMLQHSYTSYEEMSIQITKDVFGIQ